MTQRPTIVSFALLKTSTTVLTNDMVANDNVEDVSFRRTRRRCRPFIVNRSQTADSATSICTISVYLLIHSTTFKNSGRIVDCFNSRHGISRSHWIRRTRDLGIFNDNSIAKYESKRPNFFTLSSSTDDYYQQFDFDLDEIDYSQRRDEPRSSSRPYWESMDDFDNNDESEKDLEQQPGSNSNEFIVDNDALEWEKCYTPSGTAWVLLPPLYVTKPTCIVHFVGGTFMGSAPHIWYCTLLQALVRHTSCAVIATSIPITVTKSPLNHVRLSTQLLEQFRNAYRDVIVDEYGPETLQSVSICGIGHSLGARLLAVLTTSTLGKIQSASSAQQLLSYKSMIMISFTNYGAAAGIPGIANLFRKSRMVEREKRQPKTHRKNSKNNENWWDTDDENEYDFDDDDTLSEILHEVSEVVQAGATRLQNALTPPSKSFEFYPTPEQLWGAIKNDGRYTIPQTLIVQFDDDDIDQSSLLATSIMNCSDVKFARIRGTHLTPISIANNKNRNGNRAIRSENESLLQQINSRAGRVLMKTLQGRELSKRNELSLLELRQSIARYIIDVASNA